MDALAVCAERRMTMDMFDVFLIAFAIAFSLCAIVVLFDETWDLLKDIREAIKKGGAE